jgi:uncharacterized caspase-like protein
MAKNWALVIGINGYNPVNFAPLHYAKQDAERIKDFFGNAGFEVCFFADDSSPLTLPSGHTIPTQPTYGNLITFLQDRFESPFLSTGDNCWFFFAGHGERHQDRDYLMPMDANSRGAEVIAGLTVNYVQERLSRCGADNVIMILDACRSQGSRDGMGIGGDSQKGVITLASCQPTQKAWEIEELGQGAFTYAFLEALQLSGERSCATVERLGRYLTQRVPALCQQYGKAPAQMPRISIDPIEKQHFILIPQYARQADIDLLKLDVHRYKQTNPALAEQICIRLNALAKGIDLEVIDLLTEMRSQSRNRVAIEPDIDRTLAIEHQSARSVTAETTTVNKVVEEDFSTTQEQNLVASPQPPPAGRKELSECESSKILFLKNVRDPNGEWAYTLDRIRDMGGAVDSRVFELFWLSTNKGAKSASKGDLMLLNQHARITHVVEMLDDDVRENKAGYFRWVRTVWMPDEEDWSQLPHQRDVIGFEPPTIGGGTAYSLANLKKFQAIWNSLEAFQRHVFQLLTNANSPLYKEIYESLRSEKFGVNYYAKLRNLLAAKDWKAANNETADRMCAVMNRQQEGWLGDEDIKKFPCLDLRNINNLWVKYSNGQFGFSVQKEIWQSCGSPTAYDKDWLKFCIAVGWRTKGFLGVGGEWLEYNKLTFNQTALSGHLPLFCGDFWGLEGRDYLLLPLVMRERRVPERRVRLFSLVETCKL